MSYHEESEEGGTGTAPAMPNDGNIYEFINGQWVIVGSLNPQQPSQPSQPTQPIEYTPPAGTHGSYYWDAQTIIKKATSEIEKEK